MNIPHGFIHWVLAYPINRTQFVCLDINCYFDVIATSTGASQGIVLAPSIFTLYRADCRTEEESYPLIKCAYDTAMLGLMHNNDDTKHLLHQKIFVDCCDINYLRLNISKTEEHITDIRHIASPTPAVVINRVKVDSVSSYMHI